MKSIRPISRVVSNTWFAAGPLVLLFALVIGVPAIFGLVHVIVARIWGPETADNFLMNAGMLAGMVLVFAPIGLAAYAMVCVAKWLVGKKEP
jgi:predicted permease